MYLEFATMCDSVHLAFLDRLDTRGQLLVGVYFIQEPEYYFLFTPCFWKTGKNECFHS